MKTAIVKTSRLFLKSISEEYAQEIFHFFTPEVTTYMYPSPPKKIQDTLDFIKMAKEENAKGTDFQVAVLHKETKEFLGCAGVHNIHTRTPELGIWIKIPAHGNGYGKEAVTALKKWTDENVAYDSILYPVAQQNYPSRRIPESLGGTVVREYDETTEDGRILRLVEYRIYL